MRHHAALRQSRFASFKDRVHAVSGLAVVWHSGSALRSVNVVTVRRARLVLGWVTDCSRVRVKFAPCQNLINHPGQLGLAILP